jgi:cytidine deaminase
LILQKPKAPDPMPVDADITKRELAPAGACPAITTLQFETLEEKSRTAKALAYCTSPANHPHRPDVNSAPGPYSKFRVGCAVLMNDKGGNAPFGAVITGANVENASYPVGTCAERVAIGWAVAQGCRLGDIKAVAVSTDLDEHASPCGMCRQFINEFCAGSVPVLMFNRVGAVKVLTVGEVCQ